MAESTDQYTLIQLDVEARRRGDQPSFHFLSEQAVRGQVLNLRSGDRHERQAAALATLLTGISGRVHVDACGRQFELVPLTQLFLASDVPYVVWATTDSSCALLAFPPAVFASEPPA
jgi:hypothetical protein